jgi:glyoxylase-like metal-dependent hydrolase (beta-lactamase superfamily II)
MPNEIFPGLFQIEIPLPESPLQSLNSYVIRGRDRHLIIDTGFNRQECLDAMLDGLHQIDIDLNRCDFFITHLHADHFGLVSRLATKSSQIFFSRPDAELMETWEGFEPMIAYGGQNGFPENELRAALSQHPGNRYGTDWIPALKTLSDGDVIPAGDYTFRCIETPGHTLGHICLYEPDHKLLISGDHILGDITPNIQCWSDHQNPLKSYLESLVKTAALDVTHVLPGHRRLFNGFQKRIQELTDHHHTRLKEVSSILNSGPMSAYDVASRMRWDIRCNSWSDFPVAQKWFATGEALSHLRYLELQQQIGRLSQNGQTLYRNLA